MSFIKAIFKHIRTRVWAIVSIVMAALIIIVSALCSTVFSDTISMVFGAQRTLGRGKGFYYDTTAKNKAEAYEQGNAVNEKICEEGFVLLKNKDGALPLAEKSKVSVFGKNSVNLVYGGSGSGGGNFKGAATLYGSLEAAGFEINPTLKAFYEDNKKSGSGRADNPAIEDNSNATLATGETPQIKYTDDVIASYQSFNDAAIVVISRIGGEGNDLPRIQEGNPDKHYLELDKDEEDLVSAVTKAGFKKVVVLLNASTTMEAGALEKNSKIDAVMSVGGPGYSGINALGRILSGKVTPSGKTVDTWAADFTQNPTYVNFSNNGVAANSQTGVPDGAAYTQNGSGTGYYFVDYEEGIYVGYRYFETRGAEDGEWYKEQVVYPFGYGLSYTKFDWEIVGGADNLTLSEGNKKTEFEIEVKVTNVGDYAGKDVVELYLEAPRGVIEKSSTVLVGFAKTPLLYPADESNGTDKPGSAIVKIKFTPYYAASFDFSDANDNGHNGYELESGDYLLKLKTDAHTAKENVPDIDFAVTENVIYDSDPVTGKKVEALFADADDELDTVLSRDDWEGTAPTASITRELKSEIKAALASTAVNNPKDDYTLPKTKEKTGLNAIDLRGLDYDDPLWGEFLDSLTFAELKDMFNRGAFKTAGIMRLNLPETVASDGPVGFVNFISDANVSGNVSYASEYVLGCTWNVEMAEAMGNAVGEEGIFGNGAKIPTPYTGWYAPGMNLHRSPFGGRNFEYFSEDPLLTGYMAAAEISGAQSKGVVPYMKHFALNEQETHRDDNGVSTWATEQAIRELYLRPFEIAVKTADAKGVMTSFNRIGAVWTGGDYRLLTTILREEWGFEGSVICDFNVCNYMNTKQMIYAGGDLNLTTMRYWMRPDETSAADVSVLRNAAHNIIYTVVNSNAMNGIDGDTVLHLAMPVWQEILFIIEAVIVIALGIWGFFELRALKRTLRDRENPTRTQTQADNG